MIIYLIAWKIKHTFIRILEYVKIITHISRKKVA